MLEVFPVGDWHAVFGTWQVGIMPFVELSTMHAAYLNYGGTQGLRTGGIRYGDPLNWPVTKKQIPTYTCPSDYKSASDAIFAGLTFHNYRANYGNTTRGRLSPYGVTSTGAPNIYGGSPIIQFIAPNTGNWATYYSWIHCDLNRLIFDVSMADVTDGTSNTLLFSESVQGRDQDLRGFAWWGGGAHFETLLPPNTSQPDVVEQNCFPVRNPPCIVRDPSSGNVVTTGAETQAARSRHPGGVQACLTDGSVRFFTNTINLDIWRAVGTAKGGESLGEF
jgi:hypothetical protein